MSDFFFLMIVIWIYWLIIMNVKAIKDSSKLLQVQIYDFFCYLTSFSSSFYGLLLKID